jgi:hypothetical protein
MEEFLDLTVGVAFVDVVVDRPAPANYSAPSSSRPLSSLLEMVNERQADNCRN